VLDAQVARELRARGGLARALEPGHQHNRGRPRREREVAAGPAHQRRQLLVDDLDHLLAGVEVADHVLGEAALLDGGRERLHDLEVHVGLQQGETDLAHRLVDVGLGQRAALAHAGERVLQLFGEGVEHPRRGYSQAGWRPSLSFLAHRPLRAG
jgi:hypothetical protein